MIKGEALTPLLFCPCVNIDSGQRYMVLLNITSEKCFRGFSFSIGSVCFWLANVIKQQSKNNKSPYALPIALC